MAIGTPTSAILPTVPRAEMMVVPTGKTWVEELSTPACVIFFSVSMTKTSDPCGASTTENHGMSPFQYSEMEVFGVPPPRISTVSMNGISRQPFGSLVAVASTNQDLKMVCACASSVLFIRRLDRKSTRLNSSHLG